MTEWRKTGTIPYEAWKQVVASFDSPLQYEGRAAYDAAKDLSALALAMLIHESGVGTKFNRNVKENQNALNLRPPQKADGSRDPGYIAFDSWTAGIRAWYSRVTSATYGSGVYAKTTTIEQLVHEYAPESDNNNEAEYVAAIKKYLAEWKPTSPSGEPPMAITYGKVPYPSVIASHLSTGNPWVKSGAPDIPDAVFWHRMVGTWNGTNGWFHGGNAATAYGVSVKATDGVGGKIYEWIAPGSGLYGESSGPAVAPYGDGQKFINEVGVTNVNRRSKAIEISGNYDTPLDEDAKTAVVNLTAYFADQKHIPWNVFPIVPGTDRSFVIWHQEITGPDYKECPGQVVMDATPEMIDRVTATLKQYQESAVPTTPPPVTTTTPAPKPPGIYPKGMTLQLAKRLYGSLKVSWAEKPFAFDPSRSECKAWLANGKKTIPEGGDYEQGSWGTLIDVIRRGDGSRTFKWSDGFVYEQ